MLQYSVDGDRAWLLLFYFFAFFVIEYMKEREGEWTKAGEGEQTERENTE